MVTRANFRTANAVANHLQIFDHVMSSSESFNLFGSEKPKMILNKYNEYDYAGDSIHDLQHSMLQEKAICKSITIIA